MSCTVLTRGRTEPCSDSVGGIDTVEFCDNGTLGDPTYDVTDTDMITAFSGTPTWFKYECNSTQNTLVENVIANDDAGTVYYEQVLNLSLKKLTKEDHKELKLLTFGRPHARVTDRNGNVFILGLQKGVKVTGGTWNVGGALGDFNGYQLTLTGNERVPGNFLSGSAAS